MTVFDPIDWLRSANPVPDVESGPDPATDPAARALRARLLAEIVVDDELEQARRRRNRRRAIVPAALVAIGLTAAAIWVASRPAPDPTQVSCYSEFALDADIQVGLPRVNGLDPIEQCAEVWLTGELGPPGTPRLLACVNPGGIAGVFPVTGTQSCADLALDALDPVSTAEVDPVVELQGILADSWNGGCILLDDAVEQAEAELQRLGLDDWTAEVFGPRRPDRPCASFGIDVEAKVVQVVPYPR